MELYTKVDIPDYNMTLEPNSGVMLIGSCFAEHVGERLRQKMTERQVLVNPFGVLYNPVSIAQSLRMLIHGTLNEHVFLGQDGVWHSWMYTSHYSATTPDECKSKMHASFTAACERLREAQLLVITFGTTRCYRHKEENIIVANCHKEPQRCFEEYEPPFHSLVTDWQQLLADLHAYNPSLHILFTVSPYRYRKYGFHESQLQKSRLLLMVDTLMQHAQADATSPTLHYFPAYEILLDELRDYRFYATDMLHPSDQAVEIITDRFCHSVFSPTLLEQAVRNEKEYRRSQHRSIVTR